MIPAVPPELDGPIGPGRKVGAMIIGVPRESERFEHRVGLTPFAVKRLCQQGHTILVEKEAGAAAHFTDRDFTNAGAEIVYTPEEAYKRADLVCQVGLIFPHELDLLRPGSVICGFHHLAVAPRDMIDRLMQMEMTLIGYEVIEDALGDRPILLSMSDLAGQLAVHQAAHLLQIQSGGRGILLGNTPGVPPATVLIIGAGSVGTSAARHALANGAHAIVADADVRKLQRLVRTLGDRVVTTMATPGRLERFVTFADVVIGAVLIPGERSPYVVTEDMVKTMKPGSVIIDVSIDQGGCVETSRPTNLDSPTFKKHGVTHYCVPNMPANIARTASRVLSITALPWIQGITEYGLEAALRDDDGLRQGVYMYRGKLVNEAVAEMLGISPNSLDPLLQGGVD
jgi:alanine dehydrogenase